MIQVISNYDENRSVLLDAVINLLEHYKVFEYKLNRPIPVEWNNGILFIEDRNTFVFCPGWKIKK